MMPRVAGEKELVSVVPVELEVDLGTEQASGVAGADDDVLHADGLEPLLQRADGDVRALVLRALAGLDFQALAVGPVGLEDERPDAAAAIVDVVRVDGAEDLQPVRAVEAGEAHGLVEPAVAGDAEVGAEDDAYPLADVLQARGRGGPRLREQNRGGVTTVCREGEDEENDDEREAFHVRLAVAG